MSDELDELRDRYADDPVVLRAIEGQVEAGRADASAGRVKPRYRRRPPRTVGRGRSGGVLMAGSPARGRRRPAMGNMGDS